MVLQSTIAAGLLLLSLPTIAFGTCNQAGGVNQVTLGEYSFDFSRIASAERLSTDSGPDGTMYDYHLKMCGNCNYTCAGSEITTGAFMQTYTDITGMKQCYVIAQWDNTGVWRKIDNGVQVVYNNGVDCGNGNPRLATLNYICDSSVDVPEDNSWTVENRACEYTATIHTGEACTGDEGMGWGYALILSLTLLGAVYFVVGFGYNYRFEGSGFTVESIPHREFWQQVPSLVCEGVYFCTDRLAGLRTHGLSKPGVPSAETCATAIPMTDDGDYGTGRTGLGAGLLAGKKVPISADDI